MAETIEVKDKLVTVESLSALHEYDKDTYMSTDDPIGNGTMTMEGDASFSGDVSVPSLMIGSNIKLVVNGDSLEIVFLDEEATSEES